MRLNQYQKQAIVRSILGDLPKQDFDTEKARVQTALTKAMSRSCQNLYKKNPQALRAEYLRIGGARGIFFIGDADLNKVVEPFNQVSKDLEALEARVKAAVNSCSTRKQFVDRYPEFSKYAPRENEPCPTLPAVANLVADLVKAGWKQTVSKG